MPYTLCVLGCGTMGIAILSGLIDNLESPKESAFPDESAPSTPLGSMILERAPVDSVPNQSVLRLSCAKES